MSDKNFIGKSAAVKRYYVAFDGKRQKWAARSEMSRPGTRDLSVRRQVGDTLRDGFGDEQYN